MTSIALVGPRGVGKTSVARAIMALDPRYAAFSWAQSVRDVAELAYGPIRKNQTYTVRGPGGHRVLTGTEVLQILGTDAVRNVLDADFWVRAGISRLDKSALYVNDDTRFPNEAEELLYRGWLLVQLSAPDQVRAMRLLERDGDASLAPHESETALTTETFVVYANDNTRTIEAIAREILDHAAGYDQHKVRDAYADWLAEQGLVAHL